MQRPFPKGDSLAAAVNLTMCDQLLTWTIRGKRSETLCLICESNQAFNLLRPEYWRI